MFRARARTRRRPIRRLKPAIWRLVGVCLVLGLCSLAVVARTVDAKRVLILHSNQSVLPATVTADDAIRRELRSGTMAPLEVFSEFLDKERFPEPEQDSRMAAFLAEKYATRRIDVVIATGLPALDFLVQRRRSQFSGAPLLFVGVSAEDLKVLNPPSDVGGVVSRLDPAPTIELALRLQPDARHVVVVGGTTPAGALSS